MTQSPDQDTREIQTTVDPHIRAIEVNTKTIADLTAAIAGLREEIKVGFAKSEGQINNIETKLDAKIDVIRGELRFIDVKTDRPTPIGFWSILARGIAILVLGGLFVAFLLS